MYQVLFGVYGSHSKGHWLAKVNGKISEEGASEEQHRVFYLFPPIHLLRLFHGARLFGLTFAMLLPCYSVPVACWRKYPDQWCIRSLVHHRHGKIKMPTVTLKMAYM